MKILTHIVNAILILLSAASVLCAVFYSQLSELLLKANVDLSAVARSTFLYIGAGLFGLAGAIGMLRRRPLSVILGVLMIVAAVVVAMLEVFRPFV